MLHTLMLLGLGFLTASLIAFLLAPYFWRYAVHATKQHIRHTSPLTMGEIRADRDQLRAEHALQTRKLEIERDKFDRGNKALRIEIAELKKQLRDKTDDVSAFDAEVKVKDDQIAKACAERDRLKAILTAREQELKKSQSETRKEKTISVRASTSLKTAGEELKTHQANIKSLQKSLEQAEKKQHTATHRLKSLQGHISRLDACTSAVKNLNQEILHCEKSCEKLLNSSFATQKSFQDEKKKYLKTLSGALALEKSVRKQWTIAARAEPGGRKIFAPLKMQIDHAKSSLVILKKIAEKASHTPEKASQKKKPVVKKTTSKSAQNEEDLSRRIRSLQDKLSA